MTKREEIQSRLTKLIFDVKNLIILVSIRIGKTKVAIDAIEEDDEVLVVYPVGPIKDGWDKDLVKFPPKSTNINFSTSQSIKKWKDKEVDYLILDEPQLYSPAQLKIIKTIKYRKKRVALTGTLKRSTETKLLNELKLPVKVRYTLDDAIKDKLVKDYRIYIHYVDLDTTKKLPYKKFGNDAYGTEKEMYEFHLKSYEKGYKQGVTDFIYNSYSLYQLARDLVYEACDEKVLIYAMRSEIAGMLSDGNSYTSENLDEELFEWFKTSDCGHLGVVNKVQAGVTFHHLDKVIFHSAESNTEKFQQKLGRSLFLQ